MAKEKQPMKTFTKTYKYLRETAGTWAYGAEGEKGARHSGTNVVYLQKGKECEGNDFPTRPGDTVEVTYTIK